MANVFDRKVAHHVAKWLIAGIIGGIFYFVMVVASNQNRSEYLLRFFGRGEAGMQ